MKVVPEYWISSHVRLGAAAPRTELANDAAIMHSLPARNVSRIASSAGPRRIALGTVMHRASPGEVSRVAAHAHQRATKLTFFLSVVAALILKRRRSAWTR